LALAALMPLAWEVARTASVSDRIARTPINFVYEERGHSCGNTAVAE